MLAPRETRKHGAEETSYSSSWSSNDNPTCRRAYGDVGTEYDVDEEDELELVGDDRSLLFLRFSLGRKRTVCKRLDFFSVFFFLLIWKVGGGVSGGSGISEKLDLGVPGWDSHMNGTAADAFL